MTTCSLVSDELCRFYKTDVPTHNKHNHTKNLGQLLQNGSHELCIEKRGTTIVHSST